MINRVAMVGWLISGCRGEKPSSLGLLLLGAGGWLRLTRAEVVFGVLRFTPRPRRPIRCEPSA
jgi:hypothetical protein